MTIRTAQLFSALLLATVAGVANAQTSPYAGEQQRSIKALSERDIAELQSGHGMGLAKSAELNGYPGPAHVLELAAPLQLTPQQRAATSALLAEHKATARDMGVRLIAAERALDDAFARHSVDAETLDRLTLAIGRQQAQLRAEHLRTHLTQTALLTAEQVTRYSQLRGYTAAEPGKVHDTSGKHGWTH